MAKRWCGPGYAIPVMAAYTYTHTKLLEMFMSLDPTLAQVDPGDELPFVPRHAASATVGFETPRAALFLASSYVSAMRERAGQGPATAAAPFTDPSLIFDVTAQASVTKSGLFYVNVRNLFNDADIASRLPYGARPVAPRLVQVGLKWSLMRAARPRSLRVAIGASVVFHGALVAGALTLPARAAVDEAPLVVDIVAPVIEEPPPVPAAPPPEPPRADAGQAGARDAAAADAGVDCARAAAGAGR